MISPAAPRGSVSGRSVSPRDAATLIVLDRSRAEARVLMGRRHAGHAFMPDTFVFPGGRLEPGDRRMRSASELDAATAARLDRDVPVRSRGRGRALALAAVRETFEETGFVIGCRTSTCAGTAPPGNWASFAQAGALPDLAALTFVGRAITPPNGRRRYDTRFFSVDRSAVLAELPGFVGPEKELTELAWVRVHAASRLDMPEITAVMLDELARRLARGEPRAPVPFFRVSHGRFVRDVV